MAEPEQIQSEEVEETQAPVDCFCCADPNIHLNSAGQNRAFLANLQNPQVLEFIGTRQRSTWTVPFKAFVEIDGRTFEKTYNRVYKAGRAQKYICVDERDVEDLIGRIVKMRPVFRRWSPMNRELAAEIGRSNRNPPLPSNMGALQDSRGADEVQAAAHVVSFADIEGIGKSTAVKLVAAGYDVATLADYDSDEDNQVLEVAGRAQISKPLAIKAIDGSYDVHYGQIELTEGDPE